MLEGLYGPSGLGMPWDHQGKAGGVVMEGNICTVLCIAKYSTYVAQTQRIVS